MVIGIGVNELSIPGKPYITRWNEQKCDCLNLNKLVKKVSIPTVNSRTRKKKQSTSGF